jgi:hypothetical protein
MKKTIYLHVGSHKTGTTFLQNFLSKNYEALKEQGFDYLISNCIWSAHHPLGWSFQGMDYNSLKTLCSWTDYGVINRLEDEIRQSNCNSFIISSENLYQLKNIEFIERFFLRFKDFDMKPIIFLREQASFIESWYYELIRADYYKLTDDFCDFIDNPRYELNYYKAISEWSNLVGRQNLIVSNFSQAKHYGIDKYFLEILGVDGKDFHYQSSEKNQKSTYAQIAAMRVINKLKIDSDSWYKARNLILDDEMLKSSTNNTLLTKEVKNEIQKNYSLSNRMLFEDYGIDLT